MTFTEIVTRVQSRLNLRTVESATRVGIEVNDRYKRLTSSLGMNITRRVTVQAAITLGVSELEFALVEKIINVVDRTASPYRVLKEITMEEMRLRQPSANSFPTCYAISAVDYNSVTILMDCIPQDAFSLYADAYTTVATLSGSQVPAFPESFHDILEWGALADEYRKLEKPKLAMDAEAMYEKRKGELVFHLSKSSYLDIYQGKTRYGIVGAGSSSGSGGGSSVDGSASYTQTGLITFDRTSAAPGSRYPFAVAVGSEKVANLDADLLDGLDSTAFALASHHTRHELGGADAIKLDDLSTPDDNTDLNSSTTRHGLLRKLDNTATNFLDGTGAWDSVKDSDLSTSDITTNDLTTAKHGFAPKATNDTKAFLRGDAAFSNKLHVPIYRTVTPVPNVTTGLTTLFTTNLPAGLLAANGDGIRIRAWGTQAANTNNKTKILKFGATTIVTRLDATATQIYWLIEANVYRTAAATQVTVGFIETVLSGMQLLTTTPAETLANSITVALTGQSGTASNDIIMQGAEIYWMPNP